MTAIEVLNGLDVNEGNVVLWTFRGPRGPATADPKYTGRWVDATDEVQNALKSTLTAEIERIEEVKQFGLLEENHETSALTITLNETHGGHILAECGSETLNKKSSKVEHLFNSTFYLAKFSWGDVVIYACKKVGASWKTTRQKGIQNVIFSDQTLNIDETPRFDISRSFDFIIVDQEILCGNKRNFESILRYKQAHKSDFEELRMEPEFSDVFSDLSIFSDFVGENKIQLRRISAVRQKGHYKDAGFMQRLRDHQAECGLSLNFNDEGQIVPTVETCSDIITALLDHRLSSRFSENNYDVPSSTPV
ncbi:Kiwa anti-phage protein KwaB-like domain-containing protein [Phaeobacter gallaeciensis]|uniref:Kiwa anti-phage protein KwaB-like domain-containing protein n=1 Tax=Phaeobacter gallaeciensis TaxID=60890 RepID=UPI00237F0291|nr:Kiwa anti-phage protein KwaB-like domain-containing protein [Phaeobacter gallaeciensis]MDE4099102.1 DUF4868 domain-containing protein [Phaeobacter gallaeciensis]MDE4108032.1 DUF4868 domain-containing protein [Phaeobacter gallaeciensis]MDE4112366.1 DUF4868 domain-containing protein [Phaeobacter gallaeciensis]MDE4116957.1 DUF4868 domain-containing protein [Phaeobacter gallaeciensis]MDE4121308.1 DUF4868 domain-containing protein [Phaeobacter gallaeciensis]